MQVVPAEYAFVLHTANPITGARGEVFGELVHGMGEALVGNHPGRALSFKAGADGVEVRCAVSLPYRCLPSDITLEVNGLPSCAHTHPHHTGATTTCQTLPLHVHVHATAFKCTYLPH